MKYRGKRVLGSESNLRLPIVLLLCFCFFLAGLFGSIIISQVKPFAFMQFTRGYSYRCLKIEMIVLACRMWIGVDLGINWCKIMDTKKGNSWPMVKVENLPSLLSLFRFDLSGIFLDICIWICSFSLFGALVFTSFISIEELCNLICFPGKRKWSDTTLILSEIFGKGFRVETMLKSTLS